jgi:outer membrane receptor protein involved in Fe transport
MGGVVKVITPEPRFESNTWKSEHKILGQFASADLSILTRIASQGGKRGIGISGGVTYQDVDDRRAGNGDIQRPSDFNSLAANATFLYELTENQELRLDIQYLRQPRTPRFDELVAGFGQTQPSSKVFYFEPNDRFFIHGRYRIKKPLPFIDQLQINLAHQQINDDLRTRDFDSVIENREHNRSSLTSLTVKATSAWSDKINSIYGIEFNSDRISSQRVSTDIETGLSERVPSRFPNGSSIESQAFYIQNRYTVFPDLAVVFGGRYSLFDIKLPKVDRNNQTILKPEDLTGSLGMEYRITPTLLLRSNLGRGFRPPNIFDLGALGPSPGNQFDIPNPNLKPENIVTVDTGVHLTVGRFYGEIFGYYSDFNNKITSVATGEVTTDGRIVVQNQNSNEVKLWGVELYALYSWNGFELYSNLTHTWGEEKFSNGTKQPADRIPPLNGRLGFRYSLTESLWIEPFILFAARQNRLSERDANDPRINPNGTPGWVTANVRLGWNINPKWTARFALNNLSDLNYREHGSGIDAPGINAILSLAGQF